MDECLDKYFFVSYVNRYTKYFDRLLEANDISDDIKLTPNEILSAVYYYNEFNEYEVESILNLIYVNEGSNLKEEYRKGLEGFAYKTWYVSQVVKPYNDDYYKYLIVKQKNYDGLSEPDKEVLKDFIGKAYLIKKYRRKYEGFDETLDELTTKYSDISSPFYSLLWDIGLGEGIIGTKYAEFFMLKHNLNDIYKDFLTTTVKYQYEGEGLLDNKPRPKIMVYCTDAK